MSAALNFSETELRSDLEKQVLEYLRERKSAPAAEIVTAILNQNSYLTSAPVVAAIWSLNSLSAIEVGGDWTVKLRDSKAASAASLMSDVAR